MRWALYIYDILIMSEGKVCSIKLIKGPDDKYPEYEGAIADAILQWKPPIQRVSMQS